MSRSGLEEIPSSNAKSARRQDITLAEDSYMRAVDNLAAEPFADGDIVPFFDIEKRLSLMTL